MLTIVSKDPLSIGEIKRLENQNKWISVDNLYDNFSSQRFNLISKIKLSY